MRICPYNQTPSNLVRNMRHDSLIGQMDKDVKDLLNLIADDKALYIGDMHTHNDYVNLQIENTVEQICQYIENHKKK